MSTSNSKNEISELLDRGTIDVIDREHLIKRLETGEKLRVKLGIDPSGTDLHLGHAVVLRKLKRFQEYGHTIVLIIGDWTARIGDPSGKKETRPQLAPDEVNKNAEEYLRQMAKILDLDTIEIRRQTEWFDDFTLQTIIELAAKFSLQQLIQRDDFKQRMNKGMDVRYHEPMYCLLQGYDSVPIKADLEIGGNDQLFNLLKGREVQEIYNLPPQDVLTVPLLIGLDGKEKMGKSLDNYIALDGKANEMYGKVMSLPDELIVDYFTLTTDVSFDEIKEIGFDLKSGKANPRDLKARLAREIVTLYHGKEEAAGAEEEFDRVFKTHEMPSEIAEVEIKEKQFRGDELLVALGLAVSKSEAQRLIEQGGVKVGKRQVKDWKEKIKLSEGDIVQVGKRKFVRIKLV